ncbi:MAG: bifunctional phosphoribosylaminoimidazolecarboxamide formyltransferase/IMP cyclohydrolase, partial [Bacteroidia bacterium]|nr:bifunctional phosphoribosylaminoimidazolecarboxamide formyltransferase/IMP cyclohydrolase [Bacteroidia bacterium]
MANEKLYALLSAWNKENVVSLAQALYQHGAELWASAGTAQFLSAQGLPVNSLETLTGFRELLGGRVKTLHPSIFSGILARRAELSSLPPEIPPWNVVVVELYPFDRHTEEWVERIDIGGVTLLRAAAKNFERVWAIVGPYHYSRAIQNLENYKGLPPQEIRYQYAAETFLYCSQYDAQIVQGFVSKPAESFCTPLRYGENPHQEAFFLGELPPTIGGKPLSYNNIMDIEMGLRIVSNWPQPACVILKHTQPCGAAYGKTPEEAYQKAYAADPEAAYGGVVVCNFAITTEWAAQTKGHFIEVLAAPLFSPEAIDWLSTHKSTTLVKVVANFPLWEVRFAMGGWLWQKPHLHDEPEDEEIRWAARILRTLYSNAIV